MLSVGCVRDNAGAFLNRLVLFESLRDAAPKRIGLRSGVAGRGETGESRGGERRYVGCAEIIEGFAEGAGVDVAVGCIRPDGAEIGVPGKRQVTGSVVKETEVKRR